MTEIVFPKWFESLSPEDWIQRSSEAAQLSYSKGQAKKIRANMKHMLRELQRKGDMHPGIQHARCACGKEHDNFVCMKTEALNLAPEKDRLSVACKECNFIMPRMITWYGEDRAKKVIRYLWNGDEMK